MPSELVILRVLVSSDELVISISSNPAKNENFGDFPCILIDVGRQPSFNREHPHKRFYSEFPTNARGM